MTWQLFKLLQQVAGQLERLITTIVDIDRRLSTVEAGLDEIREREEVPAIHY